MTPLDRVDLTFQWSKPYLLLSWFYTTEAGRPCPSKLLGQQRCLWPLFLVTASYGDVHPGNRQVSNDPAASPASPISLACCQMCGTCIPLSRVLSPGEVGTAAQGSEAEGVKQPTDQEAVSEPLPSSHWVHLAASKSERQALAGVSCLHVCWWCGPRRPGGQAELGSELGQG